MSEAIQAKRRFGRLQDWLAALVVAGIFAGPVALLAEGLILLIGIGLGDTHWHRSWIDQLLAASIDGLDGLPAVGPLVQLLGSPKDWLPANGYVRDLFALWLTAAALLVVPARRIGTTLIARYDDETLRAWPSGDFGLRWAGPLGDAQPKAWDALHAWCQASSGTGASPFWRPWVMPQVDTRFSIAVLTGVNGVGKSHLAEALCRELDGGTRLDACTGRPAALRWRLQGKLRECLWWRPRRPADFWDSGYLVEDPAARSRLASFLPRRATLVVADELTADSLHDAIEDLNAHRADFRHPVRLLIVDSALPGSLGLRWEADQNAWKTDVQELGEVPVVDLSEVRFGPSQFRAMVTAQVDAAGQPLQLTGLDRDWIPLIEALDGHPVLLAEAIRQVRDGSASLDDLRHDEDVHEQLAGQQANRVIPGLPSDPYGKRRELMRERVLGERVRHREKVVRAALGADVPGGEEAYFAVLVAAMAGGATPARLRKMLGWTVDKLDEHRLSQVFAGGAYRDWVPPIKPAVVADEMLRRYFHAHRGAALPDDARQQIARMLRVAWLCNPGGTLRTLARWATRRWRDDFAQTLLTSLEPGQLTQTDEWSSMPENETRAEIARAMFELAVFHGGDLAQADEAMQGLNKADLERYARLIDALLTRPGVRGLPALVLWLGLALRRWPRLARFDVAQTRIFGVKFLRQAERLMHQARLTSVWEEPLVAALEDAVNQILPLVAQLSEACAGDAEFRQAVVQLDERVRFDPGVLGRLRRHLRAALAAGLAENSEVPSGEPEQWAKALMARLPSVDMRNAITVDVRHWLDHGTQQDSPQADEGRSWGKSRLLALMAFSNDDSDPDVTAAAAKRAAAIAQAFPRHEGIQHASAETCRYCTWAHRNREPAATAVAAEQLAAIAGAFPRHEGIQYESASAWRDLGWAQKDRDPAATAMAAERAAAIARAFPRHEGIQHESVMAWRNLAWAHKDHDPAATAIAAEQAAAIASAFPEHEGIQYVSAGAWRHVSMASQDIEPRATVLAARRVTTIARAFPGHEDIQHERAMTLQLLASAYANRDLAATAIAVEQVAAIASAFPKHAGIQYASAVAWRQLSSAHQGGDPWTVVMAVERVADIARAFPRDEEIQYEGAVAWRNLAWAHRDRDPAATAIAAEQVAAIARAFPRDEAIQRTSIDTWRILAWAQKDRDPAATALAADRAAAIACAFPRHAGFQHEYALAWRLLAWAQKDRDPAATGLAAKRVASIACGFPRHEGIQHESAEAWWYVAWAHKNHDPAATATAAERVATIARAFPRHEGIQHASALAWRIVVEAAVGSDDRNLILRALAAVDSLAGLDRLGKPVPHWDTRQSFPRVLKEVTTAYAVYEAWRKAQPGGGGGLQEGGAIA